MLSVMVFYTVVMNRKDYNDKAKQILSNQKTYKVLKKDPTQGTERRLNAKLQKLKREKNITENLYHQLQSFQMGYPQDSTGCPRYTNLTTHRGQLCLSLICQRIQYFKAHC